MTTTREEIAEAVVSLLQGAYQWQQPVSRRFVLWNKVDPALRPAAFLVESGERYNPQSETFRRRELTFKLYIYISAQPIDDTTSTGGMQFNEILDAIDAALAPSGSDRLKGRNTLGNLVSHCFINGQVLLDPGDLDGDGVAVVPISVLVP